MAERENFSGIVMLQYRHKCCVLFKEIFLTRPGFSELGDPILAYLFSDPSAKTNVVPLVGRWTRNGPPGTPARNSSRATTSNNAGETLSDSDKDGSPLVIQRRHNLD